MNLFGYFQSAVRSELEAMMRTGELPAGLDLSRVTAEPPRDSSHGDVATNAAMVLAKHPPTENARYKPKSLP